MPHLPKSELISFQTELWQRFKAQQRAMPWRETSDPYSIWVSEAML